MNCEYKNIEITAKNEMEQLCSRLLSDNQKVSEKARMCLIESFIPHVMRMAKKYHSADYEDLVAEGNLTLVEYAQKYTPADGPFSAFVTPHIETAMNRFLAKNHAVRISYGGDVLRRRIIKFIDRYELLHGVKPTDEVIMSSLELTEQRFRNAIARMNVTSESMDSVPASANMAWEGDEAFEDEENEKNSLPSEAPSIVDKLIQRDDIEEIRKYISMLSPREQLVLRRHYGIGCKKETLESIGGILNLTKPGVRNVELKAIKRMRNLMAA